MSNPKLCKIIYCTTNYYILALLIRIKSELFCIKQHPQVI